MTETIDQLDQRARRDVARETVERLLTVTQSIPAADFSHDLLDYFDAGGDRGDNVTAFQSHRERFPHCKAVACLAGWGATDKELNPNNATVMDWSLDFRFRVSETWNGLFGTRGAGDWDFERGVSALTAKQLAIYRIYRAIGYLQHQALPMTIEAIKGV